MGGDAGELPKVFRQMVADGVNPSQRGARIRDVYGTTHPLWDQTMRT
jgi:hypothetical protein